ncbi:MAG TPA: tRNA (guanine(10)-N(2))-dimethyltransferase [Methanocorpusculum sp.]|nr:tRNA (guanine(10)-N(2))-dimethyltransferase [Methanocorpusculum sp.]
MELHEITEGSTTFKAPVQDETCDFPPGSAPVFYNTRMEFNRDMTVLLLAVLRPAEYLDSMAATGVRGLRVANETHIPVVINDFNREATEIIRQNADGFAEQIEVTCSDANALMCTRHFDTVDLDPFGTPAPFLDAASRSAKRYLFVTATDTAPLCGAHFKAGLRRYFATPFNTEYHAEIGLRMMMGAMARDLVKYDRGMEPVLSFASAHFYRSHIRIIPKVPAADRTVEQMGFIHQCPHCLYRSEEQGSLLPHEETCPRCGARTIPIGPLWLGRLSDKTVIRQMMDTLPAMRFGTARRMEKFLPLLLDEPETGFFYDYHSICRSLKVSPPNMDTFLSAVEQAGYQASRTHFSGTGIKTTAPLEVLESCLLHQE